MKIATKLIILLLLSLYGLTAAGQVKSNFFETSDICFDRYGCRQLTFPDSADNFFNSLLSGPKDSIIMFQENPKDTVLIFIRQNGVTKIIGFYPSKKISGDYYEILGYKRTNSYKSDTCGIWKNTLTLLKDAELDRYPSLPDETEYKIKVMGVLGTNWFGIQTKTSNKYGNRYDPKSKYFDCFDKFYYLLK